MTGNALRKLADEALSERAVRWGQVYGAGGTLSFPWWVALLIESGREIKARDWLVSREVVAYLPLYRRKVRCRGTAHRSKFCPVIPGMLFVPREFLGLARVDVLKIYVHAYGYIRAGNDPAPVSLRDIAIIEEIEAKLNLPAPRGQGASCKLGQRVRFRNVTYAAYLGEGVVFEVASERRIGVEVERLIGRAGKIYVPASEIEVM